MLSSSSAFAQSQSYMLLECGKMLMHFAVDSSGWFYSNCSVLVEALLEAGCETLLLSKDRMGANCLAVATAAGNESAVQYLLRWCNNQQSLLQSLLLHTDANCSSCLYESDQARQWDIAELLLNVGGMDLAQLEIIEGDSLMLHTAEEGELAIVRRMLLLCGPHVALIPGQISGLSRSSTHFGSSGGHPEVLQVLLVSAWSCCKRSTKTAGPAYTTQ